MKRLGEYAESHLPGLAEFIGSLWGTPRSLSQYTYTEIAKVCDQALAPSRVRGIIGRNDWVDSVYQGLNQEGSPAPITAAVVIGLARVGNLEATDVEILRGITDVLPVIGRRYRPFCAAIERSIRGTQVRIKRPDYASSHQLAVIATASFNAFRRVKWEQTRFVPYTTPEGRIISSRKQFVASLRGGDDMAGACVRMAVDLGALSTQPEKISIEEREWLRRNAHYVRMGGNPRLNTALEEFNSLLRV